MAFVIRGRLLANIVEMASRAARKLTDNLDKKKVLSSNCIIFFARLERDMDAYVKGAAPAGTGGLSGLGNLSLTAGERADLKTARRATRQRTLRLGLQNNLP